MSNYIFLFDLDSTISKKEILPAISERINKTKEMKDLTEQTMQGIVPFRLSFLRRVDILKNIDVSIVKEIIKNIPLNENISEFIRHNSDRCYVVTGNLDVWIEDLMKSLKMSDHVYSSKAYVKNNHIEKVISVADKELIAKQFVQPIVSIGDGDNDAGIANLADISIGFGGVRSIAPSLLRNIDYAFYDDRTCAKFLEKLL